MNIKSTPGYSVPLTLEFLKENSGLIVDTAFFDDSFTMGLLECIEGLSEALDGVLIHSENFQAIGSYGRVLDKSVGCIYIDPPYNSKTSEILYKNTYAFIVGLIDSRQGSSFAEPAFRCMLSCCCN